MGGIVKFVGIKIVDLLGDIEKINNPYEELEKKGISKEHMNKYLKYAFRNIH